jgi:two-component system response regulator NreC
MNITKLASYGQVRLVREDLAEPADLSGQCQDCPYVLTAREREILIMVADGFGTREIADKLHINHKTVETHRQHVSQKLGIKSVAGLTRYALRKGLTSL